MFTVALCCYFYAFILFLKFCVDRCFVLLFLWTFKLKYPTICPALNHWNLECQRYLYQSLSMLYVFIYIFLQVCCTNLRLATSMNMSNLHPSMYKWDVVNLGTSCFCHKLFLSPAFKGVKAVWPGKNVLLRSPCNLISNDAVAVNNNTLLK